MKPLALAIALSTIFSAAVQAGPSLDDAFIISAESGGNGCPDGTV